MHQVDYNKNFFMEKVTTILTVYKRAKYLNEQIKAIENQSLKSNILIHWNSKNLPQENMHYPMYIYKNFNSKNALFNRFYSSLSLNSEYIFICDDDIVPGNDYLRRGINFLKSNDNKALLGVYGMIFRPGETRYNVHERIGAVHNNFPKKPRKVHMVGQGYLFHKSILHLFAGHEKLSTKSNEDICLGYIMYLNKLPIYVLDVNDNIQSYPDITKGIRGSDDNALWKTQEHKISRDKLIKKLTDLGWKFN